MNREPVSDVIWLEESEHKSWSFKWASWASFHYIVNISHSLSVQMRKEQQWLFILTNQFSPESTKIIVLCVTQSHKLKKPFQSNWGLNLGPCPWDLILVIDWHTNNTSHHGWPLLKQNLYFVHNHEIHKHKKGRGQGDDAWTWHEWIWDAERKCLIVYYVIS